MKKQTQYTRAPYKRHKKVHTQEDIDIAEKNGISYHTFYRRVYKHKWSLERARTEVSQPLQKEELYKRAEKNGLPRELIRDRLRRGWTEEEAVTRPQDKRGRPRKHKRV